MEKYFDFKLNWTFVAFLVSVSVMYFGYIQRVENTSNSVASMRAELIDLRVQIYQVDKRLVAVETILNRIERKVSDANGNRDTAAIDK